MVLVTTHANVYKNALILKKCQKSREIAIFVGPFLVFCMKIEISGGHISGTRWSWRLPFVLGEGPWFPLQKRQKLQKSELWVM